MMRPAKDDGRSLNHEQALNVMAELAAGISMAELSGNAGPRGRSGSGRPQSECGGRRASAAVLIL